MTINIKTINDNSIILERIGLVTKEQLISTYEQLLIMDIKYAIVDDRNMMLQSHATIFNIDVQSLVDSILLRDSFQHVIVVVPEDSEMRVLIKNDFHHLKIKHKLTFADDFESAKAILEELQK